MKKKQLGVDDVMDNFEKKLNKKYQVLNKEKIKTLDKKYKNRKKEKQKRLMNSEWTAGKNKKQKKEKDNNLEEDEEENENENVGNRRDMNVEKRKNKNKEAQNKNDKNIEKESELNVESELSKEDSKNNKIKSFEELNICEEILQSIKEIGWTKPTNIQQQVLPYAFQKRDIIGLSETGSGKSACFLIPILQELKIKKQSFFALIIAPTRELCIQIAQHCHALGSYLFINICTIFGGVDIVTQSLLLAKKPNIIIGTPGRLLDHLNNTKGFNLKNLKYLVFDEADKLLSMDFETSINKLLLVLPKERTTYLFSATMSKKVAKLKRASLKNPVNIEVSNKYSTASNLIEQYIFIPFKYKFTYLASLCLFFTKRNIIVFANTCATAQKLNFFCRNLGLKSICLHGKLTQTQRLSSLNAFKANKYNILISTAVGARGLDLKDIKIVINFDLCTCKEYIHRVGRTARAGRTGKSITFVTQYDVENFLTIEKQMNKKIEKFTDLDETDVLVNHEQSMEALRQAEIEMKENQDLYRKKKYKKKSK